MASSFGVHGPAGAVADGAIRAIVCTSCAGELIAAVVNCACYSGAETIWKGDCEFQKVVGGFIITRASWMTNLRAWQSAS
jgi:hypothetical protein